MLRLEWKNLFKNKILLIVILAVVAIPMIYTTLFLGSMWDPYGNINKLPVAIINHDQPAEYEGTKLSAGSDLVEQLRENASLNFCFPSEEEAEQGLKDGTYYMVITIPEDFSANAATLTASSPEKMELYFETNPGTNYIASKMSESAMKELELSVREEVTKTYASIMFQKISEAGEGLADASDGSSELKDGAEKLMDGSLTLTENLQLLSDSTLTFSNGSVSLREGLSQYVAGVQAVSRGADTLDTGAGQLRAGIYELSKNTPQLAAGTQRLSAGASALYAGADSAKNGSAALMEGAKDVNENMASLSQGLAQLEDAAASLPQAAKILDEGMSTLSSNTKELQGGANNLSDSMNSLKSSAYSLSNGLLAVSGSQYSQSKALCDKSEQLSRSISSLRSELQTASDSDDLSQVFSRLTELEQQADTLSRDISSYTAGVNESSDASSQLAGQISALTTGTDSLSQGLGELYSGAEQLKSGTAALNAQAPALVKAISDASAGSGQLWSQGTSVLLQGTTELNTGLSTLSSGAEELKNGTEELNTQIPALSGAVNQIENGSSKLKTGTESLVSGTKKLNENESALLNGAQELTDGASQISEASSLLAAGGEELSGGLKQAADGAKTLEDELEKGAAQIQQTSLTENTEEMFAAPVNTEETQITNVADNGHAMAPYMMSVALWVGCIAFSLMYPLTSCSGKMKSGIKWWGSKASVLYAVATLQALVMIGALHLFNGFSPAQMGRTILTACIASLTFMSIMYFFTSLLGKVGSFLMLVFMVMQLAGSVGTYPLEISGSFVPLLHKWVPFTYTVKAFRSTISGGGNISGCLGFLLILLAVFTMLTILEFQIRSQKIQKGRSTWTSWLDKHGLGT